MSLLNDTPLQYSCLENPMDGGAWWATVHGVAKNSTWLSDFTFTFHFDALEKEMATHSSVLAWRIPGTGEPGGLPSMGSHRVGHNWSDLAAECNYRRKDPAIRKSLQDVIMGIDSGVEIGYGFGFKMSVLMFLNDKLVSLPNLEKAYP